MRDYQRESVNAFLKSLWIMLEDERAAQELSLQEWFTRSRISVGWLRLRRRNIMDIRVSTMVRLARGLGKKLVVTLE